MLNHIHGFYSLFMDGTKYGEKLLGNQYRIYKFI